MEERILVKVHSDNELSYQYIDKAYSGDWCIIDGKLYKGDKEINEDHEIIDDIKQLMNSKVTIF